MARLSVTLIIVSLLTGSSVWSDGGGERERERERPSAERVKKNVAPRPDEPCEVVLTPDAQPVVDDALELTNPSQPHSSTYEKLSRGGRSREEVYLLLALSEKLKGTLVDDFAKEKIRKDWLNIVSGKVSHPFQSVIGNDDRQYYDNVIEQSLARGRIIAEHKVRIMMEAEGKDALDTFTQSTRGLRDETIIRTEQMDPAERKKIQSSPAAREQISAITFHTAVNFVLELQAFSSDSETRLWALGEIVPRLSTEKTFLTHDEAFQIVRSFDEKDQPAAMRILLPNVMTFLQIYSDSVLQEEFRTLHPDVEGICRQNAAPTYSTRALVEQQQRRAWFSRNRTRLVVGALSVLSVFGGSTAYYVTRPEPPAPPPIVVVQLSAVQEILKAADAIQDAVQRDDFLVEQVQAKWENLGTKDVEQILGSMKFNGQKNDVIKAFVNHAGVTKDDIYILRSYATRDTAVWLDNLMKQN